MSNELKEKLHSQTALINLDGFDGIDTYTDEREGGDLDQDQVASPRLIQGIRIGFNTKQAIWVDESDQPLPNTLRLIFANVIRIVQKWGTDNLPIIDETIILGPNEKWPNIDAMNEKCPKTEWRLRHGQHVGPYEPQKLVYLWDPNTMQKYTWPASNNSSMACVSDLVEKIQAYRQFKQPKALPVIKLDSRLWSKRFNMRGANLIVLKWITRDDKTGALVEIPDTAAIAGPKPTSTKEFLDQFGAAQTVSPMTAKEATDDEVKF